MMGAEPTSYERLSRRASAQLQALRLPEPIPLWQWAAQNRNIPRGVTPKPGRYDPDFAPYQREPQEAFFDRSVQVTVLVWASRLGKTEMALNALCYSIGHDPRSQLVFYPTLDSAENFSKKMLQPSLEANPTLLELIGGKSRDSGNTIRKKNYPGGMLDMVGANSPSSFRQIQASLVFGDELDAMDEIADEGDPVSLAMRRADNYRDSVKILASTPTVTGFSRIWEWLEKSDFRKWHVPCLACGHMQVLTWATHARLTVPGDPRTARIICESCGREHTDTERVKMVRAGEWRPTRDFTGVRGYWLPGINSVFPAGSGFDNQLHKWATERIDAETSWAQGKRGKLQALTNTFDAETYEDPGEELRWEPLYLRRAAYDLLPESVLLLTAAVDVQGDRLELEIVGWGENEETWGIEYIVLPGKTKLPTVWRALDDILQRTWTHPILGDMRISACAVDTGGHSTPMVYDFVSRRSARHVFAVKGASVYNEPVLSRPRRSSVKKTKLYIVGTDTAKSIWYERLAATDPDTPGYCHFPAGETETVNATLRANVAAEIRGYDQEYFESLTAERRVVLQTGMVRRAVWKKLRDRNEALDIRVYSLAALEYCKHVRYISLPVLQRRLERTAGSRLPIEADKEPAQETLAPPRNNASSAPRRRWRSKKIGGKGGL
jgi:phage terminase large subunit GpA-like protein